MKNFKVYCKTNSEEEWDLACIIAVDNFSTAKKYFTDYIRILLSEDPNVIWLDEDIYDEMDSMFKERNPYKGQGYYPLNEGYQDLPLIDSKIISTYNQHNLQFTINNIN